MSSAAALMAGKTRVHELAKELGVTSKEILTRLNEEGEFIKSASSTVEAPVARRLREFFARQPPSKRQRRPATVGRVSAEPSDLGPRSHREGNQRSRKQLTKDQTARIRADFCTAYAAENRGEAINSFYLKYEMGYRVSRATLREVVAVERRRLAAQDAARRPSHNQGATAKQQQGIPTEPTIPKAATSSTRAQTAEPVDGGAGRSSRPRKRVGGLAPLEADLNVAGIADLVAGEHLGTSDRGGAVTDLQAFDPMRPDGYGYLAWRCALHRRSDAAPMRTPGNDLAAIAQVVEIDKQLLGRIGDGSGAFLDHPQLAKRLIDNDFRDLFDSQDIGRSAADELRRVRAADGFLSRAVLLTIAAPDHAEHLWDMVDRIRPPAPDQLIETTSPLITAIGRLNSHIVAVERLLSADDAALENFFRRSLEDLIALQAGRFDFLRAIHALGSSGTARQEINALPFAVLPQGESLRRFLNGVRSAGHYRGYHVDVKRLNVLVALTDYFGVNRCDWFEGSGSSRGVDNHYLILAIRSTHDSGQDAVAVSPVTGEHATYVVRHECTEADWATIFTGPKIEARRRGARRLFFTAPGHGTDQYEAMRDKIITLLECDPRDFRKHLVFDEDSDRYRIA